MHLAAKAPDLPFYSHLLAVRAGSIPEIRAV